MAQTIGPCVAGIIARVKGSTLGGIIGTIFGPVGTTIGSLDGGIVGHMAGSKIGKAVIKGSQKIRDTAVTVIRGIGNVVKEGFNTVKNDLKALLGF